MTDPQHSLIAVLLDRSGSMESIKSDTEGGFNAFIAEQRKEPLDIRVTLAQFDTDYDVVYANRPVQDVPPLELQPRGMTALYDALGKLITDVGAELAAMPEQQRPAGSPSSSLPTATRTPAKSGPTTPSARPSAAKNTTTRGTSSSSGPTWMPSRSGSNSALRPRSR